MYALNNFKMRLSYLTLFYLFLVLSVSCNSKQVTTNDETNSLNEESSEEQVVVAKESLIWDQEEGTRKEELFQEYISFFEKDSLPVIFNAWEYSTTEMACFQLQDYIDIRKESGFSNSSFCPAKNLETSQKFTMLLSVENNFIFNASPILETYSQHGILIDLKALDFGWEMAETTQIESSIITINPDLTIKIESKTRNVDLIEEQDENGNYELIEVEGSVVNNLNWIDGHVDAEGIIHFQDPQSKTIE